MEVMIFNRYGSGGTTENESLSLMEKANIYTCVASSYKSACVHKM